MPLAVTPFLCEQLSGALGQLQQLYAIFHVVAIGLAVALDVVTDFVLLHAPLARHSVEECCLDTAVELVHVHGLQALLEAIMLCPQPLDRLFVLAPFVLMPLAQRLGQPGKDLVAERQMIQHRLEALDEHFLADVGLAAVPLVAGATVVDITALLHVADQRAAAVPAFHQAGKRKIVLLASLGLGGVSAVQNTLDVIPNLSGGQRRMLAFVDATVPIKIAGVKSMPQNTVQRRGGHRAPGAPERQACLAGMFGYFLERVMAGGVPVEHIGNDRTFDRIDLQTLAPVGSANVAVAHWCAIGPKALFRLFLLALAHFFGQVIDVVLRHQHLDAVDELLR